MSENLKLKANMQHFLRNSPSIHSYEEFSFKNQKFQNQSIFVAIFVY